MKKVTTESKKRIGRPTKYTEALADEICERIANGEMLLRIVRDKHMPERSTIYEWLEQHDDFSDNYARACKIGAHALVEQGLEILDGSNPDCAQVDNNRANYRKWLAAKRNPTYGDRQAVALEGGDTPVKLAHTLPPEAVAPLVTALKEIWSEEEN